LARSGALGRTLNLVGHPSTLGPVRTGSLWRGPSLIIGLLLQGCPTSGGKDETTSGGIRYSMLRAVPVIRYSMLRAVPVIRYSMLRAVPVFLPPARSVARRSSASHPVFHGLGDTKLPQTGFAHRVLERRSSGLDCRPTALPRPLRSPWLTPIRKPSTHQLGQFRPLSRARPARHAPGHAHIGGERVILETTKHAHRPRCNGHLLWQLKKNGFARPGGMVGQTTEAETRVSN
jgi:hypothetical protein